MHILIRVSRLTPILFWCTYEKNNLSKISVPFVSISDSTSAPNVENMPIFCLKVAIFRQISPSKAKIGIEFGIFRRFTRFFKIRQRLFGYD